MHLYLQIPQYVGFVFTEITNLLLLWLILTKSSHRLGSYKHIMMSYALFSVVYAVIEIMTQPVIYLSGACFFIYIDSFLKYQKSIGLVLMGLYCASFGLCVSLLATHFVYRYVAICRPQNLHQFQGFKLLRVYLGPVFLSGLWYFTIVVLLGPSVVKEEYMRDPIKEMYTEDTSKLSYIAALYYYTDQSGKFVISFVDFIGAFTLCGIMQFCILTMTICGWKTYKKLGSVGDSMSRKTRELNSQLFKTLVFQTLIPLCIMFGPVGGLYILPMFSISVGKWSNAPSVYAGFYPALDALVAIFMIRDFRNTVLCRNDGKTSKISTTPATHHSSTVA